MRIGQGYDLHRLVSGRALLLGGVRIPHARGLAGHSDADVLAHAVGDALLGALGAGDLGVHFPSGDERWRNASGARLLGEIVAKLAPAGFAIANVDATILAEEPRLAPFRVEIQESPREAPGRRGAREREAQKYGRSGRARPCRGHRRASGGAARASHPMSELDFYNTLTRRKDAFVPLEPGSVRIYSCGPTVYSRQHLGNLRAYVFTDLLNRTLRYFGYWSATSSTSPTSVT
jgi:2-C-methyl-D-erythritol 2,4-cyclodiphosphate synthase